MDDVLLYFGGEVKALDDKGLVGGYLVRFTDAAHTDLSGEYFTAKTYLGPTDGDGAECIFEHGYPVLPKDKSLDNATQKALEQLADHMFRPIKTKRDAVGIWAETVLKLSDEYEEAVFGMVKSGKLGWSSGSPGHRVRKNTDGEIIRWPIAEGSLTPRPCEPQNKALTLKSLAQLKFVTDDDAPPEDSKPKPDKKAIKLHERLNGRIADLVDDGNKRQDLVQAIAREAMIDRADVEKILAGEVKPTNSRLKAFSRVLDVSFETLKALAQYPLGPRSLKDMFTDELTGYETSTWRLWDAYACVVRKLAMAAAGNRAAGTEFDVDEKLTEATGTYMNYLLETVTAQIATYVEAGGDDEFYLKAIANLETDLPASGGLDFDQHCSLAVSALRELVARFRANHEARVKAGRVLSEKNRQRISTRLKELVGSVTDLQSLLDESMPRAKESEKRAALTEALRLQQEAIMLGVAS